MRIVSSEEIEAALLPRELVETLRQAYRSETVTPDITRHTIQRPANTSGTMKLAPAWSNFQAQGHANRGYIGCSVALDLPAGDKAEPSSGPTAQSGVYLLMSGDTGRPIALFDGPRLALWRQCGLHALAAHYLSRSDASRLLVLDANVFTVRQLSAYCSVRDIRHVLFVGASEAELKQFRTHTGFSKIQFSNTDDIAGAIAGADIIFTSDNGLSVLEETPPTEGVHISVVGTSPDLPSDLSARARLFVGDRQDAAAAKLSEIAADLKELAQGLKAGRRFYQQITLFAGGDTGGLADFATAGHVFLRS
ncbi:MAG: ornithine cyclodeaminase [Rhodobacteraceae bacterium]|nr:ornithine cyclodeaminase [Paracoccaceae bacterium]